MIARYEDEYLVNYSVVLVTTPYVFKQQQFTHIQHFLLISLLLFTHTYMRIDGYKLSPLSPWTAAEVTEQRRGQVVAGQSQSRHGVR